MVEKYEVSSLGRFRSSRGVVFTPAPNATGYAYVRIDGTQYNIGEVMLLAFKIPRRPNQTTVDHIDGLANEIGNLQWASYEEQNRWKEERRRLKGLPPMRNSRRREVDHSQPPVDREPMPERWKRSKGSLYVSTHGRIKFGACGKPRFNKPSPCKYVYVQVDKTPYRVHRLIAEAFLDPPRRGQTTVDHINGVKHDNDIRNLRWASPSEQNLYAIANGHVVNAKNRSKPVQARKIGTRRWITFPSAGAAARCLKLNSGNINKVLRKQYQKT
eukprot:CAMPEP_0197497576 /NCGR_PEP_ID=MMETSP1311-20131121/52200_1 /TAXON_ID=464262 /ORGANISM="Genus nov. species nov., Strain RCC856" /LENGTH=270 /DNA_ID=CAMNT_0043043245 /DNA_START=90 /DNA_END=898 /DNA_ORIENTATION=+